MKLISELKNDNYIKNGPGVYVLYKRIDGNPKRVGRSEDRLKGRVGDWSKEYKYYQYSNCSSIKEAYDLECKLWHKHINTLDNRNHPDKPTRTDLSCPVSHD